MKKLLPFKTIRGRIITYTAAAMLALAVITVTICFTVFQSFLRRNQIQSAEYNLQMVCHNVEDTMNNFTALSRWCSNNGEISHYLEAFKDRTRMPSISSSDSPLRITAISTYTRLKEEYRNTPRASEYITRVIISPVNRRNYLLVSDLAAAGTPDAAGTVARASYFAEMCAAPDYLWDGFHSDPFSLVDPEPTIPLIRPINSPYSDQVIGWSYFSVSSRLITDSLRSYPQPPDSLLYVTIGSRSYVLEDGGFREGIPEYTAISPVDGSANNPDTQVQKIRMADGSSRFLVTCPLGVEGWTISNILSESAFFAQRQVYLLIIGFITLIILCMGAGLALTLNKAIGRPVKRLCGKIDDIARGDFSRMEEIEGPDEFGIIGRGINGMSENVVTLMDKRVEDERQKKDLEYQILQSQINPHFLYNTLNSIKWMATIQNATGIAEMTTSLARLMKNVSKGTAAQIPLKEELDLVKDYFLIQQYRYGGSITLDCRIESEELYRCLIHRFTLQPIIENALFHGIEPKGCAGHILLSAERVQSDRLGTVLQISVTDNGVGMSREQIEKVLSAQSAPSADFFRQVGIHNVNQRIHYDFGEDYGISIDSVEGQYTTMTITLPYRLNEL